MVLSEAIPIKPWGFTDGYRRLNPSYWLDEAIKQQRAVE